MITDNPTFKRMISSGEEQFGKVVSQLIANESFLSAIQGAVTRTLEAKGAFDRQVSGALQAMHVPSTQDVQKINDRLDELERIFEGLSRKVDAIAEKLDAGR